MYIVLYERIYAGEGDRRGGGGTTLTVPRTMYVRMQDAITTIRDGAKNSSGKKVPHRRVLLISTEMPLYNHKNQEI